jgi:hypothetical protein
MSVEHRSIATTLRAIANADRGPQIAGYAATFDTLSAPLPGGRAGIFRERLSPGCFTDSLRRADDVRCLQDHNSSLVLGRTKSGTLKLTQDNHGLYFECSLPPTQAARDLHALVQRGDLDSCSFGFMEPDDDWTQGTDPDSGQTCAIRTIRSLKLFDVSVVAFPAYESGTSAAARNLRSADYTIRLEDTADAYLRRLNALLGAEIAADERRMRSEEELRERLQNAAGIVSGRRWRR